jgi:hypothetical protein
MSSLGCQHLTLLVRGTVRVKFTFTQPRQARSDDAQPFAVPTERPISLEHFKRTRVWNVKQRRDDIANE